MNSLNLSFFLLFTLSLLVITLPANEALNLNLLTDSCSDSLDVAKCVEILKSDPLTANANNIVELAKATLKMCMKKATDAQNFVRGILLTNNNKAIEQCANFFYEGTVMSFKSSLGELIVDIDTANYDSKVASDGPNGCDEALRSGGIQNPAIASLNADIKMLSSIAFSVTSKLPSQ